MQTTTQGGMPATINKRLITYNIS